MWGWSESGLGSAGVHLGSGFLFVWLWSCCEFAGTEGRTDDRRESGYADHMSFISEKIEMATKKMTCPTH